ncbi:chloride channel protein [Archaeoglobales archaeon]|nr:MAG: chloride channel protein [Archaeoglobales archaeon]
MQSLPEIGWRRVLLFPVLIGILSGVAGIVLHLSIDFFTDVCKSLIYFSNSDTIPYYLLPPVGALIAGIIVYFLAPEAEGAGENAAIEAFHKRGHIRLRVSGVKLIATSLIIGSGGSAGREGPLAQISASIASFISSKLKLREKERRVLIVCGMAAGVGSIFKAPLGGAIFAIEVLYKRDHEVEVIIPSFIAAITAFLVFGSVFGLGVIFQTEKIGFESPIFLLFYALLGVAAAFFGRLFINLLNVVRELFLKLSMPNYLKPAMGGIFMGVVAYFSPHSIGIGYEWVQKMIFSELALNIIIILLVGKIIATSFTIGSGGSGGLFAPSLVIGASIGGLFAEILSLVYPDVPFVYETFVLVGMAAFITAVAKTPISAIILMVEIAHSYKILPGLMIASIVSYALSGKESIYPAQVETRFHSPALRKELTVNILEEIYAMEAMIPREKIITVSPSDRISEVFNLIEKTGHTGFPVIDDRRLVGIITFEDVEKIPTSERNETVVKDVMSTELIVAYPDENLESCLQKLVINDIGRLPIVDRNNHLELLGLITRTDIIKAHAKKSTETHE